MTLVISSESGKCKTKHNDLTKNTRKIVTILNSNDEISNWIILSLPLSL